ncbi:MAG: STAS domain-containing protein [Nitrospiraceae bacterium]
MLKITEQRAAESESMSLTLEGRLAGPWVEELDSCWRQMAVNQQRRTVIDLTGVTFVDSEGKALLARIWREGAEFVAAGCLTKCIVEDITAAGRVAPSKRRLKKRR